MSDVEKVPAPGFDPVTCPYCGDKWSLPGCSGHCYGSPDPARPDEWNAAIEVAKQVTHDQRTRWEEECKKATGKSIVNAARYADMAFACGEVAKQINNLRRPAGEEG